MRNLRPRQTCNETVTGQCAEPWDGLDGPGHAGGAFPCPGCRMPGMQRGYLQAAWVWGRSWRVVTCWLCKFFPGVGEGSEAQHLAPPSRCLSFCFLRPPDKPDHSVPPHTQPGSPLPTSPRGPPLGIHTRGTGGDEYAGKPGRWPR